MATEKHKPTAAQKRERYRQLFRNMCREWAWLFRYIKKYWKGVLVYILMGVLGTLMGLGVSVATKYLIDAVVGHEGGVLGRSIGLVIGLAVLQILLQALSSRISSAVGSRVHNEIRGDIYERMVMANWEEISAYHSGELINRLEGDVSAISSAIVSFIPSLVTRLVKFAGSLCIVLYYDTTMAVLALLSAPVIIFTSRFMMRRIREYNKESRELNGKILSYGEESLQNLQTVKAFGLMERYVESFRALLARHRQVRLDYDRFSILMTMCLSLVGLAVSYACYGWGVWRLWQGAISYGTMTLFIQLSGGLTSSFSTLVSLAPSAVSIATSAGRVMELGQLGMEEEAAPQAVERLLRGAKARGAEVRGRGVCFRYRDGERTVLKDAQFHASPGETVALIGPSGEGKTTLLRLILGLMRPEAGELLIGVPGEEGMPAFRGTRALMAYVPQEGSVFSGSIADNLRLARPEATDAALIEALKAADAWDFVSQLPGGLYAAVEERGGNFSAGQAQRLAIARALLREAPILLMDEATSALDVDTEGRVLKNIMVRDPKRVCILTTHRPSMLEYCTRVYKIAENGNLTIASRQDIVYD